MTIILMMTTSYVQGRGLNSLVVYLMWETCDIWEGDMTTMSEIQIANIRSLGLGLLN